MLLCLDLISTIVATISCPAEGYSEDKADVLNNWAERWILHEIMELMNKANMELFASGFLDMWENSFSHYLRQPI